MPALCFPGGPVKCSQMPGESFYNRTVLWRVRKGVCGCQRGGLFAVVRQLGAGSLFSIIQQSDVSSSSPGGSVKVFTDAWGGLFTIIRPSGGFVKVFIDAREGAGAVL